jgi:tetratricopeptide (TPR) repeat protein
MRVTSSLALLALVAAGCLQPTDERVRAYNEDGIRLYEAGAYGDARESFQAALSVKPDDPGLLYNLAQCYDRAGDTRAERYYDECLQRAPEHAACHHALDAYLVRTGRWPDAARNVEDWLSRSPKSASAHAEDGWLWFQAGDVPRAQARLQEALLIDPNDALALSELGHVYEQMERPDRAVVLYEQAVRADPHRADLTARLTALHAQGAGPPRPE